MGAHVELVHYVSGEATFAFNVNYPLKVAGFDPALTGWFCPADDIHIVARHAKAITSYTLNQFQTPNETTLQFNAAAGSVKIELHRQRWGMMRQGESDWSWRDAPVTDRDAHFMAQANAFLDQIEGKPERLCSLDAAAQTLRFNLAAINSADADGRRESCQP